MRWNKQRTGIAAVSAALVLYGCSIKEEVFIQQPDLETETVEAEPSKIEETETSAAIPETEKTEEESFSFADLKGIEFILESGAGAWQTNLTIREDGSFKGLYYDSNMGETGEGYPGGTRYQCSFYGQFTVPERVDDYTYKVQIQKMNYENETGSETIADGIRYCYSEAYGLSGTEDIFIYLKGSPILRLPEGFRNWTDVFFSDEFQEQLPFYGLYNETEDCGFYSFDRAEHIKELIEDTKESTDALDDYITHEAATQMDLNISAAEMYRQWDDALNQLWSVLKEILPKEEMDVLTLEEREWIAYKEQAIKEAGMEYEGGSMQPMAESLKGAELTRSRVYELLEHLDK